MSKFKPFLKSWRSWAFPLKPTTCFVGFTFYPNAEILKKSLLKMVVLTRSQKSSILLNKLWFLIVVKYPVLWQLRNRSIVPLKRSFLLPLRNSLNRGRSLFFLLKLVLQAYSLLLKFYRSTIMWLVFPRFVGGSRIDWRYDCEHRWQIRRYVHIKESSLLQGYFRTTCVNFLWIY